MSQTSNVIVTLFILSVTGFAFILSALTTGWMLYTLVAPWWVWVCWIVATLILLALTGIGTLARMVSE